VANLRKRPSGPDGTKLSSARQPGERMPNWNPFHGWMAFRYLDVNAGLTRSFTIGYRLTDDGADEWTARFNRFKAKKRPAIGGGVNMMTTTVPLLVRRLGLDPSRTVFIPALSSSETIASERGVLSVMARACAEAAGTAFAPDAITKNAHQPLHNVYNADRRREILDEAEYKSERIRAENILIFDDFITRGDTLSHIAQAIHEANRRVSVYGVALGKTERCSYHRERFGVEISNDHVPAMWAALWEGDEAR